MVAPSLIDIAVRAHTVPQSHLKPEPEPETVDEKPRKRKRSKANLYLPVIIHDTETRVTPALELLIGVYRLCIWRGKRRKRLFCLEEGIVHADGLTGEEMEIIRRYWRSQLLDTGADWQSVEVAIDAAPVLRLRSESDFRALLYEGAYNHGKGSYVQVGHFDVTRYWLDWGPADARVRDTGNWSRFQGGFSGRMHPGYVDESGWHESPHHPRYLTKHLTSTKAFRGWGAGFKNPPVDLRQFAFALSAEGHSLESGCERFEVLLPEHLRPPVEHYDPPRPDPEKRYGYRKAKVPYGRVSPELITYNRDDVLASQRWYEAMVRECAKHPVSLSPQYLYSPATVAKIYLRHAGIRPRLELQPDFPIELLGIAMSAFFGARTECKIRKVLVPVRYCDLLSAYPTVCMLMRLWWHMIAARTDLVDDTSSVRELVAGITLEQVLSPGIWEEFPGFALIEPEGDVLPARGRYDKLQWNIGVNHLWSRQPLWYSIPDVIASAIITGRTPKILRALRLRSEGVQSGLRPMNLRGQVKIDPATMDFFKAVIEERQKLPDKNSRLGLFLKIMANAGSYGIWAQFDRREIPGQERITIADGSRDPWTLDTSAPEAPGDFCFPPLAANITAGTRLLLAIYERLVTDRGGTWATMDTDSGTTVSSRRGGLVPCPGGPYVDRAGRECVRALAWDESRDEVQEPMRALNEYGGKTGAKQILELEDENYALDENGEKTDTQQELCCYSVASKRYALANLEGDRLQMRRIPGQSTGRENPEADEDLDPADMEPMTSSDFAMRKHSDHSLGGIINPSDPHDESRDWKVACWHWAICRELGIPCPEPKELDRFKLTRGAITTWNLVERFEPYNRDKEGRGRMGPRDFFMAAELKPVNRGEEYEGSRKGFTLIAPFEADPEQWPYLQWIRYQDPDGPIYSNLATTHEEAVETNNRFFDESMDEFWTKAETVSVAVKTIRDTFERYTRQPETKMLGPDGRVCKEDTIGHLSRRCLEVSSVSSTGKGMNAHEEQLIGLRPTEEERLNTYVHPDQIEEEIELVREALRTLGDTPQAIARRIRGLSSRTIRRLLEGDQISRKHMTEVTKHVRRRAIYDVLPSQGFDLDELKPMSTVALLKTLLRHGERICDLEKCTEPARVHGRITAQTTITILITKERGER